MNPPDFQPLLDHLISLGPFLYKPNGGNGGDAVIALATIQLFNKHQLPWQIYTPENYARCKTLVYGGGGGFLEQYSACSGFIEDHFHDLQSFTLLPHSVSGHDALLNRLDHRFHLFAREKFTLEHLKSQAPAASTTLSHDLALALDPLSLELPQTLPFFLAGQPLHYQFQWLRKRRPLKKYFDHLPETAAFFRTDSEAAGAGHRQKNSIDFSRLIKGRLDDEKQIHAIARLFISLIRRCQKIETDRLHVGIVAGLCQIPCTLHTGNNFKIQGIYEHSLHGHLQSIVFKKMKKS